MRRDSDGWVAEPFGDQHSHVLASVVAGDPAEVAESISALDTGDEVRVHLLVAP